MGPDPTGAENRAILLTGAGAAGIAVVRLIGPGLAAFLNEHFSRKVVEGRPVHGELRDGEKVVDDPVVVLSDSGRMADINLHGGAWIVQRVLELAARAGFEILTPSIPLPLEITDGQTTIRREVLAWLPAARTELAVRALLRQPELWKQSPPDEHRRRHDWGLHWLLNPPRVAIVGIPNVGKSTLANQLFAQERSIMADAPGTTRDWVGEMANIDGLAVMLVDTPGVRESGDAIEQASIEHGGEQARAADLVIVVLDSTQAPEDQLSLLRRVSRALVVMNKSDRPGKWDPPPESLATVATSGKGVDHLRDAIKERFGVDAAVAERSACWTDRQRAL